MMIIVVTPPGPGNHAISPDNPKKDNRWRCRSRPIPMLTTTRTSAAALSWNVFGAGHVTCSAVHWGEKFKRRIKSGRRPPEGIMSTDRGTQMNGESNGWTVVNDWSIVGRPVVKQI